MSKKKIDFNKIREIFSRSIYFLGKKSFLVFIILTFIALFGAATVFYFYVYVPFNEEPEIEIKKINIDDTLYKNFIEDFTKRTLIFKEADSKIFKDLFFQGQLD
jgi:hypothetical protein